MRRMIVIGIAVVVVLALAGGGWAWYAHRDTGGASFQTVPVKRGTLQAVIGATGTVEPEEVIDVGAQVQGQIDAFGKDDAGKPVDNNSTVEAGVLLAHIDDSVYDANVASAKADVDTAHAAVAKAEADILQMKAKLGQAGADWERAKNIGSSDALAKSTYDAYRYGYDAAVANVALTEAELVSAQKGVTKAEAALRKEQRNLDYCTIKSPVKGTVISRRVNIGQTVVASLNAPSLFLIARDLTRVQVWASVNEADIGHLQPGQDVTFTVDTYPGRDFAGKVSKVRLDAQMTQNVVTYPVEIEADNPKIEADNPNNALLPYMTANVKFQVSRHDNVLLVPNAALRWSPVSTDMIAPDARADAAAAMGGGKRGGREGGEGAAPAAGGDGGEAPTSRPSSRPATSGSGGEGGAAPTSRPSSRPAGRERRAAGEQRRGTLWIQDGKFVRPVRVRLGLTDGTNTEVQSDQLKEGAAAVIGEVKADDAGGSGDARNPFAPQFPRRPGGGGGK